MGAMLVLVVGFGLLVCGADKFVEGASELATKLGIPSLVIGLTIVAFGTSAPELAVSVTAGINHANEIALGNIVGSNIFNLLVVVGTSAIFAPLIVDDELLNRDWTGSILATIFLAVLLWVGRELSRFDGYLLLIGFSIIMGLQIKSVIGSRKQENEEITENKNIIEKQYHTGRIICYMIMGLASIIIGGQFAVDGATELARMFQISETVIGLTIVAIGTSLPELVTSVIATRRGEHSIAIGNVIGSNLFNVMFILGISSLCNPIPIQNTAVFDTIFLIIISVVLWVFARKGRINKIVGVGMVMTYAVYTVWIVAR